MLLGLNGFNRIITPTICNRMPVTGNNWLSDSNSSFKKKTIILNWKQELTFIFLAFRPVKRGNDGTLTMFQNRFINMIKATLPNVANAEIDDSSRQLNDRLKEKKKDLREEDIPSPWTRDQPGQRSEEVIDECICVTVADTVPHQFLDLVMNEWVRAKYWQLATLIIYVSPSPKPASDLRSIYS